MRNNFSHVFPHEAIFNEKEKEDDVNVHFYAHHTLFRQEKVTVKHPQKDIPQGISSNIMT